MIRVLIVDDDQVACLELQKVLEKEGFTVSVFNDGMAAIQELKSRNYDFDLVITGLILPKASGLEIISRIRMKSPQHIPVIILNGLVQVRQADEADPKPRDLYRPILPVSELLMHVHGLLSGHVLQAG